MTQWGIQKKIILPSFLELERNGALSDVQRTVETIKGDLKALDMVCFDWSSWTDTWTFVKDKDPEYIASNLVITTFRDGEIHLFIIVDALGKVIWGRVFDPETMTPIQLEGFSSPWMDLEDPLFFHGSPAVTPRNKVVRGIVLTSQGPLMMISRPILKSDYTGPARGHLLMGRFINGRFLAAVEKRVRTDFELITLSNATEKERWARIIKGVQKGEGYQFKTFKDHLEAFTLIPDITGQPALLVRTRFPRDISRKGLRSVYFAIFSLIVVSFVVLLVVGILIQRLVLGPIQAITRHAGDIQEKNDFTLRMAMDRRDEIGELAHRFDAMVARIDEQTGMLRELSLQDSLTGLANRREFDRHLIREWKRMQREKSPLSLLICDVDRFKRYNDRYGHPAGDKCLSLVAAAMEESVKRPGELVARYGGEEFAVILPNTSQKKACQVAERIRMAVEDLKITHQEGPVGVVTLSLGGASVIPSPGVELVTLLNVADNALYAAKARGRNQTVLRRLD